MVSLISDGVAQNVEENIFFIGLSFGLQMKFPQRVFHVSYIGAFDDPQESQRLK